MRSTRDTYNRYDIPLRRHRHRVVVDDHRSAGDRSPLTPHMDTTGLTHTIVAGLFTMTMVCSPKQANIITLSLSLNFILPKKRT